MHPAGERGRGSRRTGVLCSGGFTLIEVIVAAALLAVVTLTLYSSFSTVLNGVERARREEELRRMADFLVTHFEKNISGAYLSSPSATRKGAEFVGEDADIDGRAADALTFCTTAARMTGGALPGDTKEVTYALEEVDADRHVLTVYEQPRLLLGATDETDAGDDVSPSWAVPVASLDFQYFDGSEWYDSWDTGQTGKLPWAVKIQVEVVEQEVAEFLDKIGLSTPELIMVVPIPLGLSEHTGGAPLT